jgi:hypothetical protein
MNNCYLLFITKLIKKEISMGIAAAIVLIVLGILGASSLIIKNKPEAKDLIDKIVPFQGWIGIGAFLWGIWIVIQSFLWLNWGRLSSILWFILILATGLLLVLLGFIFGYGLINKFALSKANNEEATKKAEEVLQKLVGIQIPLGIISIILGIVTLIWNFIPVF